jgi:hypothetical protein
MLRNFPALIQNTGWEIELSGDVIKSKQFNWNASINLTIPRNKLVNFPDIENSSYAYFYEVGQSIHVVKGYNSLGVNPATGVFAMEDKSGNGTIGTTDRIIIGDLDPRYYGGLRNTFSWKGLELDVFLEYKRQLGTNYLYALYGSSAPGNLQNQPTFVMSRWQKPGDIATIQQFTTTTTTAAYGIIGSTRISNIVYSNASYVRVKNLALSYRLPKNWLSGIKMKQCRVYLQAQNLFTFYKVKGIDPEVAVFSNSVPMLRTLTAGFQVGL